MNQTASGITQIRDMGDEELRIRLSDLRRSGALGEPDEWEFKMSMGFAAAVNREAAGKGNGPTAKVRSIARSICREHRYHRISVPDVLIDPDDSDDDEASREMAQNYEDF